MIFIILETTATCSFFLQINSNFEVLKTVAWPSEHARASPDATGATKEGTSWETTPLDIAKGISKKLAEVLVVAKAQRLSEYLLFHLDFQVEIFSYCNNSSFDHFI